MTLYTFNHSNSENNRLRKRFLLAVAAVMAFATLLIGRLVWLQVLYHPLYSTLSQHNTLTLQPLEPNRGLIYDRNGKMIAENQPAYTLAIIPDHISHLSQTLSALNKIVHLSAQDLRTFHNNRNRYHHDQPIPLKFKLSEEEVALFYLNQFRFPGVVIRTTLMRHYPMDAALSHALGYVGRINPDELKKIPVNQYAGADYIGKHGIEKVYEAELRGQPGVAEIETDASGHSVRILGQTPPTPGSTLYLTIDSDLQQIAENAFEQESGALVAIQPETGQILALVSAPSFDSNGWVNGLSEKEYQQLQHAADTPLFNRATQGQFALASTIKPFLALAALDQNIIQVQDRIYDPGWFQLPDSKHIYKDWVPGGHGWVNVNQAIIQSCDVFFYKLALKMGIQRLNNALSPFGFGAKTGIDLDTEKPGLLPTPEWKKKHLKASWFNGDTVLTGIGQDFILTTPLQLANATAALAMHGQHFQPTLLLKTQTPDGIVHANLPQLLPPIQLQNPKNWDIVIQAMRNVIDDAASTAKLFGHPVYSVAAKTGTAQVFGKKNNDKRPESEIPKKLRNNHLLIAFAPIDHPKIAIAAIVEHGNSTAKIVRQVMDYYLLNEKHLNENEAG